MNVLDYQKVTEYSQIFQKMKQELFPNGEYQYRNEACSAFAHLLSEKARTEFGVEPMKIWCYKSEMTDSLFGEMKQNSPEKLKGVVKKEQLPSLIVSRIPGNNASGIDYLMWQEHHVAMCLDLPIYKNSSKRERIIFDPVLFENPVREKDWINALNTNETYIQYTPAEANTQANQLNLRSKMMLKDIEKTEPICLLKSPLMVLANVEKRKNVSKTARLYQAAEEQRY